MWLSSQRLDQSFPAILRKPIRKRIWDGDFKSSSPWIRNRKSIVIDLEHVKRIAAVSLWVSMVRTIYLFARAGGFESDISNMKQFSVLVMFNLEQRWMRYTSFRTGRLERELQMVQLSATRCSCIAILWVSLVSFAAITICIASQRVLVFVVYFVIDSVRTLLDTPS
jgi:hypothetical protein